MIAMTPRAFGYEDTPLPHKTAEGEALYNLGQALVARDGVRLQDILWDADEVLWDWVMDLQEILRSPRAVLRRSVGHREYFMLKPGVFELLWGMHHASLTAGLDPYMRIWTNGYPWRLLKLGEQIPGFFTLLGITEATHAAVARSPHIFSRPDYVAAVSPMLLPTDAATTRQRRMDDLPQPLAALIEDHLDSRPADSSLKLPELARWLPDKAPLHSARLLVDDQPLNIARFVRSGRRAVQVVVQQPLLFHRMANITWGRPLAHLTQRATTLAAPLAQALSLLASDTAPAAHLQALSKRISRAPAFCFDLDIPDDILRAEWINPTKALCIPPSADRDRTVKK